MLELARHIFMSILRAEDGVGTIQLQGPGVGDVWFPRGKFGCFWYKRDEL